MLDFEIPPADAAGLEALATLQRLASVGATGKKSRGSAADTLKAAETSLRDLAAPPAEPRQGIEHWSEQTLRNLIELLPDAVVVIDQGGVIALINEQTERVFGYAREEMLGRRIELLVPEEKREGHVGKRTEYFAHPKSRPMGARLNLLGRRKDGSEFPVEISLSPLFTEQGVFATSVIRDISQRKRDEAKFRTLVENIPAVTFIAPLDESTPELYVSPQIEQLLGFSQKEWLEDPVLWYRQLHPEDQGRWNRQFAPTCATGERFNSIYRLVAKDGRVVWVHGSASVVRDAEGLPSFLQGVAFDITAIREAEEAMHKAQTELQLVNAELERRVVERTKELEAKAVELERFARQCYHDLGPPLGTIEYRLQRLADRYVGQLDEDADKSIGIAHRTATKLTKLRDKLMEYARAVRAVRSIQPVDCNEIVREVKESLQKAIDESGAEITASRLPPVMGVKEELVSLFQNLIGNAIKYRDPSRTLNVYVEARAKGERWLFSVRDNGSGIEEGKIPKLFKLGSEARVHRDWRSIEGHGYGMHICNTIVASHGGTIEVESKFGEGTTFYFTLPPAPSHVL